VAEQLGLQQLFGYGAAVDGNKWLLDARACPVHRPCQQSLPVPLSPRISTLASLAATSLALPRMLSIAGLRL